ncbi:hypothetical protein GYB73_08685 [Sinorhizobium meliloti]|nr:hypothetical protein [Sinorhizobium meliloti]MDW9636055.1 hypothetical protein [Sinorhizobium meliloti]MDW9810945.1 hypothetical protein [Sinorhizobium meliloti]MDX0124321.1 hypothetical protein [Sinorhizobium meliloti]MDX0333222.1 hypothetical protein [Sinorhizobium meliloti]
MEHFLKRRFPPALFKNLLLDLEDRLSACALNAHTMVRDHAGLDPKRSRELEGQARFRMMEKAFQETCEIHGGALLTDGILPLTDLRVFQPFMRLEHSGHGIIFGLAAMPEPGTLPVKNMSRKAGVTLNYYLSPRLDLDGTGPKIGDIFVLFLVARDRERAGKIREFAVGVIDAGYEQYLFYEPLDKYLEGYADEPVFAPLPSSGSGVKSPVVSLKKTITPFIPPEQPGDSDGNERDTSDPRL